MDLASPVTRAALLVGLEGAALTVLGAGYGIAGVVADPFSRLGALLEAAFAVVLGVLVVLVARGLLHVSGWSRSPAVVLQLLALPVGVGLLQGQVYYAAAPVLGLAGAVLFHLATPEARLAFRGLD